MILTNYNTQPTTHAYNKINTDQWLETEINAMKAKASEKETMTVPKNFAFNIQSYLTSNNWDYNTCKKIGKFVTLLDSQKLEDNDRKRLTNIALLFLEHERASNINQNQAKFPYEALWSELKLKNFSLDDKSLWFAPQELHYIATLPRVQNNPLLNNEFTDYLAKHKN